MLPAAPIATTDTRLLDWFTPDPRELARHDDPEKVRQLGRDLLANGQLQPVAATEDGRLIFGHGRWLAAKAVGLVSLEVKVYPATLTPTQFKLIRAAENLQRKDLTGYQVWVLCWDLLADNPDWQMKDLAGHLNKDPSMVTRWLSPARCVPAVRDALRDGRIGISDCYAISKRPEPDQVGLLALRLSGASRDQVERAGRRQREAAPAVKLTRIKAVLPSGVSVVASGAGLTLDDLVDALGDAQREAKKAREQGLDAKTFAAVMRDKARRTGRGAPDQAAGT